MLRKLALWVDDMATHTGLPNTLWHAMSLQQQQNAMMGVVPHFLGSEQNAGNKDRSYVQTGLHSGNFLQTDIRNGSQGSEHTEIVL